MDTSSFQKRMKRLFKMGFTVMDIAEPLVSFDADRDARVVLAFMQEHNISVAGVRNGGFVRGYVQQADLDSGSCGDHMERFDYSKVLTENASFAEVIERLAEKDYSFVSILGHVEARVCRYDLEKPPVRMWLFGMITILEMFFVRTLEKLYPNGEWKDQMPESRLQRAIDLQQERKRRCEHHINERG